VYAAELIAMYAMYFAILYLIDKDRAQFMAGLSLSFTVIACLISRPEAPHDVVRYSLRPWIGLIFLVNVAFSVLTAATPDYASLVPGLALMLIMGSAAECVRRSREKKQLHDKRNP
jgi:hypothetical protein